jgi:hypothetical protein
MGRKKSPSEVDFLNAIESGDIKLVERLLEMGADIRGVPFLEYPAACAARLGHLSILELLIRHGADPRYHHDTFLVSAAIYNRQDILKFLCATVFAPDLWRGKSRGEIEKEADMIYRNIELDMPLNLVEPFATKRLRLARIELFDAAMTCWEHVRPDPPKIKISDIPAKGKAL